MSKKNQLHFAESYLKANAGFTCRRMRESERSESDEPDAGR